MACTVLHLTRASSWDKTGHFSKATCFSLQRTDTGWATTHLLEWDVWLSTGSIPDPCPCCSWAQESGLPRRYWSFPACCLAPEELGGGLWSGTLLEFISSDTFFSEHAWFRHQRRKNVHGELNSLLAVDMIWELLYLGCYLNLLKISPKPLAMVL